MTAEKRRVVQETRMMILSEWKRARASVPAVARRAHYPAAVVKGILEHIPRRPGRVVSGRYRPSARTLTRPMIARIAAQTGVSEDAVIAVFDGLVDVWGERVLARDAGGRYATSPLSVVPPPPEAA